MKPTKSMVFLWVWSPCAFPLDPSDRWISYSFFFWSSDETDQIDGFPMGLATLHPPPRPFRSMDFLWVLVMGSFSKRIPPLPLAPRRPPQNCFFTIGNFFFSKCSRPAKYFFILSFFNLIGFFASKKNFPLMSSRPHQIFFYSAFF